MLKQASARLSLRCSSGRASPQFCVLLGQRGAKDGVGQIAKIALEGLQDLIAEFDYQETPYAARPRPNQALIYNDFEHLARIKEWSTGGEGDQ